MDTEANMDTWDDDQIREFYDIERLYKDVAVIPSGFDDAQ